MQPTPVTRLAAKRDHQPSVPSIGDLYRLPDLLTGFSKNPAKHRWCMVVTVDRYSARVVPRSASSTEGVLVLRSARPDCFTTDGRFYDDWRTVLLVDVCSYENAGPLPATDREEVVEQYRASQERRRRARRQWRAGT
jgi:hypothetical protein